MLSAPTPQRLPSGYTLHTGYPSVEHYCHLRATSGLTPVTAAQALGAVSGSWYGCYVTHGDVPVAMGRVIGDGGWYFMIADMAVLPAHQRRGLGGAVLQHLLARIKACKAEGRPYVTLMADPPGRELYARNGFVETAPASIGMVHRMVFETKGEEVGGV